ncbi:restriction endonuclease subunit S [Snodgrassella communis]|uniref:restriction endonuclease subunit S n=1 Tax=Snodgrassella communis TaxID=2946699 RepID=UPI000689F022|nr:restriction endonuclease subunit S [Snodgrassella communis]
MSESKKLIPRRRFHSFIYSDDWSLTRLENLGNFNPSSILPNQFEYVDLESVVGNQMVSHRTVDRKQAPSRAQRLAKKGDIFYQTVRPYQQNNYFFNLLEENYVFSTGYAQIRPFGDGYFLFTKLQERKFLLEVLDNCIGTSFPAINSTALAKIRVFTPLNIEEQYNIGNFFQKLDNLINTQQKKLEKAKTLKSAYLTEMFPNEGELKPRLRFNSFINAWHIKDINDLANRYDNFRIPITASNRKIGLTPYYGANGIQDYVQGFTHDGEYILIAEDGANDFKNYPVQYVKGKIWVNNHAHVLQGKIGICDNKFLMNAFKNINIEPYLVGGSRAKLNSDTMMNISLKVPNQQEQTKIGNFFKLLDDKIALEQKKLDKLKNIKQAYLNEMFV